MRGKKRCLKSSPYFQQPIKSESNGAWQRLLCLSQCSQYSPFSSFAVGSRAYEKQKKKKEADEKQIKDLRAHSAEQKR